MNDPIWLEKARTELGQHEINGPKSNPEIIKFFKDAGHPEINSDETAWCAAFVGAMLKRAGVEPSGSLLARSYLTWGDKIDKPDIGSIAVLWRGSPEGSEGHVGFVVDSGADFVKLLGGNHGSLGTVSVETFPRSRVLGFRWPSAKDKPSPLLTPASIQEPAGDTQATPSLKDRVMTDITSLEAFLPTIELYAPTVGQLLGGPVGGIGGQLAAVGIHALAHAFGVEPTVDAVASHMDQTPILKAADGLRTAEELAVQAMPSPQTTTSPGEPQTVQDAAQKVFHDAGVTNPTIVMVGSLVVTALSGWLVNKGWVTGDASVVIVGAVGGLISSASAIYHSLASNANTKAMAAMK